MACQSDVLFDFLRIVPAVPPTSTESRSLSMTPKDAVTFPGTGSTLNGSAGSEGSAEYAMSPWSPARYMLLSDVKADMVRTACGNATETVDHVVPLLALFETSPSPSTFQSKPPDCT